MPHPLSPIFVINNLSETVAKKGSVLLSIANDYNADLFADDIFDHLSDIVETCLTRTNPWVIIEGGDGTAQGILTALLKRKDAFECFPIVTLLPGGMTNQVAGNIGLKTRDDIQTLLQANLAGTQMRSAGFSLLQISAETYPDHFGFLFSTGAIPMITNYTKSKLHKRGIGGSLAVFGGILRGLMGGNDEVMHKTPVAMTIDKHHLSEHHLGTVITTLPNLILGIDPFWGHGDAPLRVTLAGETTRRLMRNAISIWRGNKSKDRSSDGLRSWRADTVTYAYDGPIVLDGEFLDIKNQVITVTATEPIIFRTLT